MQCFFITKIISITLSFAHAKVTHTMSILTRMTAMIPKTNLTCGSVTKSENKNMRSMKSKMSTFCFYSKKFYFAVKFGLTKPTKIISKSAM